MKIAFLHPYKMADHYFVEAFETAMIGDLCADGHEAEAADYLFDPARSDEEQSREMRAALEARGYEAIFLERPWSDAMVRALSGLRVIAYARPELVERGLVDVGVVTISRATVRALVRALASGEPLDEVPGIVWRDGDRVRRTEGAQEASVLSELGDATFDYTKRRALSARTANEKRAVVLSNLGCAYRNVPNRTGVFDDVPMPEGVSTAGCTFCDVTAYERMSEADAIRLIVRQVEAVLRDRPEVREIAVKDDYAVRFLGALGDALRPLGLGDREVLLSARADYLLEHRAEIEEALAGRFPAPLGFYLIGFENFSQAELDRFNKGMSSAQLERVLVLMREWTERFPRRFKITPTGGFILFTPWTTLEDLRINANAIRQHGFERYRGRALLSQLRLYPNLPLYWLAKRDGLLVDKFERPEMSDAHRRGYEMDHPWRFRDARVEEVWRRLLDASSTPDAELFEAFEDALDDAAGIARGKRTRPLRMVRAPRDVSRAAPATRQIQLNRACNQGCGFCMFRGVEVEPPRRRAARAIEAARAAAKEGARTIVLTGAEPMLEWYLADLVRFARDLGIADVVLETNATLLDRRGAAEELASAGVTRAVVAFNATSSAVADAITRDPGGHERTTRGVRALLAAGIPVELAVPLLPENRGALAAIATEARALFPTTAAAIEAIVARVIGAAPRGVRTLGPREAATELTAGVAAAARAGIAIRAAHGGELPPCAYDDPQAVRAVLRLGEQIVQRDAASYERIPACAACAARAVCPGPSRALAKAIAAIATPLSDDERGAGIVPASDERKRVLREYRSQFFQKAPGGAVQERRVVRVNFHCNQACDFCFVSRELPPVEHEIIVKELREVAERGAVLDLSGGEPSLNPRLPEYIALARELGVRKLELQTNAIKMADPAYARTLRDAGLDRAFVSLHGTSAAVSDRVTAAPGTFEKTVQGVRNLLALGVVVQLNFVLCGYNVADLAQLPDFVAREIANGIPDARVDINFSYVAASTDNVPRDTRLIPRFTDIAWTLAAAHERATALGLRMTGFDSKCGVPACYLPRAIREEHFARDIPDEERALAGAGFAKSAACARCELDKRCYGIRSSYADLYGTAELRPIVNGEAEPIAAPLPLPPTHRGTVWAAIGLSPSHALRPDSTARLSDDGAFARLSRTFFGDLGLGAGREVLELRGGLREVIKTERGSVAAAEQAAELMASQGFVSRVYVGPPGPGGSAPRAIAFTGRSAAAVDEAMAIEPGLTASFHERAPLVRRMGALLGYPPCCVEAFAAATQQDDDTHIARLARAHPGPLGPEQNWAAVTLRPFSHFPCTPTCAATARHGRAVLDLFGREDPRARAAFERALRSVTLVTTADRFAVLLDARADGRDAFVYDGVLSHRNLGADDGVLARPTFRAFYLEVVAPLEEGRRVVRTDTSLVVERDGRTIAEILFAREAPRLLDFTAARAPRRLPVATQV